MGTEDQEHLDHLNAELEDTLNAVSHDIRRIHRIAQHGDRARLQEAITTAEATAEKVTTLRQTLSGICTQFHHREKGSV